MILPSLRPFPSIVWVLLAALLFACPQASSAESESSLAAESPAHQGYKLGDFRIKAFRPIEREKVKMQFTLYAEVAEGTQERFEQLQEKYEHRIRNQIITAARLIPSIDYDDPTLHALRRLIYLRLRRNLPELRIESVFVSDFSYLGD